MHVDEASMHRRKELVLERHFLPSKSACGIIVDEQLQVLGDCA